MRFELPDFRRCCCCVPLRHGILIYGYLNLAFTIFVIGLEGFSGIALNTSANTMSIFRGVEMYTQLWFHYALYSLELILNIVLLVGAHTKQVRLMRVYYYYGIMTTVASSVIFMMATLNTTADRDLYYDLLPFFLAFSGFALQAYLLLLIRAEMRKLKYQQGQCSFVNHMSEVILDPPVIGDGRNPL